MIIIIKIIISLPFKGALRKANVYRTCTETHIGRFKSRVDFNDRLEESVSDAPHTIVETCFEETFSYPPTVPTRPDDVYYNNIIQNVVVVVLVAAIAIWPTDRLHCAHRPQTYSPLIVRVCVCVCVLSVPYNHRRRRVFFFFMRGVTIRFATLLWQHICLLSGPPPHRSDVFYGTFFPSYPRPFRSGR